MITDPWLLTFIVFGLLVILGTTAGLIDTRLYVSEPLACVLAGIAVGPLGLSLVQADPGSDPTAAAVLQEAARITLAVAVTAAAMRLPKGWLRSNWRGLLIALGPGMLLMAAAGAGVAAATLGLPLMVCLLIGAALAPTDPVLSAPILTGKLAARAVPDELRYGLTAESGVNDGLAMPLVMLPILLLGHAPADAGLQWVLHALLWEVGCAVVIGGAVGWLASHFLGWAERRSDANPASMVTVALVLAVTTLAGVQMVNGDGVLAAFAAGAVLNEGVPSEEVEKRQEHFNEAFGRFFDLPVMILFGAVIPWSAWLTAGWRTVAFALGILLLRRLPAWLLLRRWMPWTRPVPHALFAGWFGPIGAAALFYAMEIQEQTGLREIWPAVSLAVAASVLAHGATGTPLTHLFGRTASEAFRRAAKTPGADPVAASGAGERT